MAAVAAFSVMASTVQAFEAASRVRRQFPLNGMPEVAILGFVPPLVGMAVALAMAVWLGRGPHSALQPAVDDL